MTLTIWAGTFAAFAVLMAVDLVLTRNAIGLRAAAVASALWIAAALAFGGVLWLWRGPATAGQYFAGYLLEKALSVDNIFVFVMLFASLQVPAALQRRVLHLGVVGRAGLAGRLHRGGRRAHRAHQLDLLRVRRAGGAGRSAHVPLAGHRKPGPEPGRARAAPGPAGHRGLRRRPLLRPG